MAELSELANKTLATIAAMPTILRTSTTMSNVPDVVHVDLIRSLVGHHVRASEVVAELVQAGHVVEVDPCHYQLIDVPEPADDGALTAFDAFISWHVARATMADKITQPFSWRLSPGYDDPDQHFESAAHAMDWFRGHGALLISIMKAAFAEGWHDLAFRLAEPVWSLCRHAGRHDDELATQMHCIEAADHLPDEQQALYRAVFHSRAAYALSSLQRHQEAISEAERGVELARQTDTPQALSTTLSVYGRALQFAGEPRAALESLEQALALAEQVEDTRSIALRHRRIGEALIQLDDIVAAINHFNTAAELMSAAGDDIGRARVLTFLGRALLDENEPARVAATVLPVLDVLEKCGCALYAAEALELLGEAAEELQEPAARAYYIRAIEAFQTGAESDRAERLRSRLAALAPGLTAPPFQVRATPPTR